MNHQAMYYIMRNNMEGAHIRASVLTRKKDGNERDAIIKRYTFRKIEDFTSKIEEIEWLCKENNARFYVNPSPKSDKEIAIEMIRKLADAVATDSYNHVGRMFDRVADQVKGIKGRRVWVIDIDNTQDEEFVKSIKDIIIEKSRNSEGTIETVKTKTGVHLLVLPHHFPIDDVKDIVDEYNEKNADTEEVTVEFKKNHNTLIHWSDYWTGE